MRFTFRSGDKVVLRHASSDAYGEPRGIVYTVDIVKERPGYVVPWVRLAEAVIDSDPGSGFVKASELRRA